MEPVYSIELQPLYKALADYEAKMGGKAKIVKFEKLLNAINDIVEGLFKTAFLIAVGASLLNWSIAPMSYYFGGSVIIRLTGKVLKIGFCKIFRKSVANYCMYRQLKEITRDCTSRSARRQLRKLAETIGDQHVKESDRVIQLRKFWNISTRNEFKRIIDALYIKNEQSLRRRVTGAA